MFSCFHECMCAQTHTRTQVYNTRCIHWVVFASSKCYSTAISRVLRILWMYECSFRFYALQLCLCVQVNNYNNRFMLWACFRTLSFLCFRFILTYLYRRYSSLLQKRNTHMHSTHKKNIDVHPAPSIDLIRTEEK